MTGGECDTRVPAPIPTSVRKVIQELMRNLRYKHSDELVYTTLKDSCMDPTEAGRRLKMILDIREIAGKHSVEDVYTMLKECNLDANEAAQRLLYIDTFHEVKKKHDRRKIIISDASQENKQTRVNQWRGDKGGRGTFYLSKVFEDVEGGRNLGSRKEYGTTDSLPRVLRPTMPDHTGKENNVVHVPNSCDNMNGTPTLSNGSYNHKLAPELSADGTSSTADHVVVSSKNAKHICSVGTIKCEIVKQSCSDYSNARAPAGMKFGADQFGTRTIPVIAIAADSDPKSNVAENNQITQSLHPLLLSNQNSSQTVNPIQDNLKPSQSLNEPLKANDSEHTDPDPEEESDLNISTPKLDAMIEKLTLSSHQAVIFPDHLQIPENYKCQFVFGSLDTTLDDCKPISLTESSQQNEIVKEPSVSNEIVSVTAQEGKIQDHSSEDILPLEDNILSDSSALNDDQTKVELVPLPPSTGFQNLPVLQTVRDYSYGYVPPVMGTHFVQLDIPELQNGASQVVSAVGQSPVTQPAIVGQSSMASSPPLFPYFRPYPNYIPYNPYFPHMYLPQSAHLLNHGVFPPPPPTTTNVQHMQAAAAVAVKSLTSQNKQGNNEDITTPEEKINSISTVQQGEDQQAWAGAPVHDIPNLLPNYFYNFPHGQLMPTFSPLQAAALYHSSQTLTAQSTIQPPLIYQPQLTGGAVEPMVQQLTSYNQHLYSSPVNQTDTALLNTGTG
ncbi:hypothetical protein R6Q57_009285 [Mikania cordata]